MQKPKGILMFDQSKGHQEPAPQKNYSGEYGTTQSVTGDCKCLCDGQCNCGSNCECVS